MRHVLKHLDLAKELRADWEKIVSDPALNGQDRMEAKRRWLQRVEKVDFDAIDAYVESMYERVPRVERPVAALKSAPAHSCGRRASGQTDGLRTDKPNLLVIPRPAHPVTIRHLLCSRSAKHEREFAQKQNGSIGRGPGFGLLLRSQAGWECCEGSVSTDGLGMGCVPR